MDLLCRVLITKCAIDLLAKVSTDRNMKIISIITSLAISSVSVWAETPEPYVLGELSMRKEGVPRGEIREFQFHSKIYEGTERRTQVYVPQQYKEGEELALMVVQDGTWFAREEGRYRLPCVVDNLIHRGEIPKMAIIFTDPGLLPPQKEGGEPVKNRSFEYDSIGPLYSEFLVQELIPEVERRYHLKLTKDPTKRTICGASSGASCAFTVAWERPDQFRNVISFIGSFVDLRGAHNYPPMIRKAERKPIRIFLQGGRNDNDNDYGNWPLANEQMAAAFRYKDYDHQFVMGHEGHNAKHAGAIFPDVLRWIWMEK